MSNKKILIVEDDADVGRGYQVLLKANHYDTFLATDAVSAVNEALKHQPDLMILDLGGSERSGRTRSSLRSLSSWCPPATFTETRYALYRRGPKRMCRSGGMTMSCWR